MSRKSNSTGDIIEFPGQEHTRPPDMILMFEHETRLCVDGFRIKLSQLSEQDEYDQTISLSVHQARRLVKLLPAVIKWCEINQPDHSL